MSRKGNPPAVTTFPRDESTGTRTRQSAQAEREPTATCTFARRLLDAGRAADAMQALEANMEAGMESAEFQFLLGRAAFRLGHHVQAHRAFSRAVALSPQDAEVYRWLTRLILRRNDAVGAMRALEWTSRGTVPPGREGDLLHAADSPFDSEPDTITEGFVPPPLPLGPTPANRPKRERTKP